MNKKVEQSEENTIPIDPFTTTDIQFIGPANKVIPIQSLPVTIGRDAQNGIQFIENSLSPIHARIYFDQRVQEICIEDLNSSTGIFINDKPTSKNILTHDTRVRLGELNLTYRNVPRTSNA